MGREKACGDLSSVTVTVTVEGKAKDRRDDSDNLRNKDFEERQRKSVHPIT
jgi:hypothetical protein